MNLRDQNPSAIDHVLPAVVGVASLFVLGAAAQEWLQTGKPNWESIGVGAAVLVGLLQILVMRRQAAISADQVRVAGEQNQIIDKQNDLLAKANAIQTSSADAASSSAAMAADTLRTNREIERAYLVLRLRGKVITELPALKLTFPMEIVNIGKTPCNYLGGFIGYNIGPKPTLWPDMHRSSRLDTQVYLVTDEVLDFTISTVEEDHGRLQTVIDGKDHQNQLWVFAELDYLDRFGSYHTFGCGRAYSPKFQSLPFAYEGAAWNFDRPLDDASIERYKAIQDDHQGGTRETAFKVLPRGLEGP